MSNELVAIIVVGLANVAVVGFLWGLSKHSGDMRERLARVEERSKGTQNAVVALQSQMSSLIGRDRGGRDEQN